MEIFGFRPLEPASKEPPEMLEAAEQLRRLAMKHFPKARPDLEGGAFCVLMAKNGKSLSIELGQLKKGAL